MNPIMIIPFILTPMLRVILAYFSMSTGIVPLTNGANIPWTTPPIISKFLVSGWWGALLNIVQIVLSMLINLPFLKTADNSAFEIEKLNEGLESKNNQ
ncbi:MULTISPECIES: PTS sugar transporter subunit IIC [unclassified Enterococcus]|uniref:PTS sugar transporter subunit IIC n=1 Tax=unclassified Enterococcus TaxID=2608891 RepID=UPI0019045D0C|nr:MULTISPECIES: PTS sugar transporter subunit IIC [unclassified Enterococcus]MBK0039390.1 PTS sugar transporter subunit IIC [Enterococcus sp. S52]MBK0072040.1 PTS sugar transporter subunit IIC [Enterococcus sp. S53]MBK0142631.1 PTS sugar transporter subunit IIC [Enterococcus sp. S76]MBK0146269.1 PTS sugar transporter subunit IIC [Enterococcus sp. S77]